MIKYNFFPCQTTKNSETPSTIFPNKVFEIDPTIPIITILQTQNDFRSEKDINKVQDYIEQFQAFSKFLNISSEYYIHNLIVELTKGLTYKSYHRGTILLRTGELDEMYMLLLKGSISMLRLTYLKLTLCKEDFMFHLLKLHLLKEYELLNQSININSSTFPELNSKQILSAFTAQEVSSMKKEINNHKWFQYKNINDYLDLITIKETVVNITNTGKAKYSLIIPQYQYHHLIKTNYNCGTLTPFSHARSNYTFIANEKLDVAYFNKKELKKYRCQVYERMEDIIGNDLYELFPSYFVFQGNKKEFFIKKNFARNFIYHPIKKGEQVIVQNTHHDGMFFIKNGKFKIYTTRNYNEINELISDMKKSLNSDFPNYVTDLSKKDNSQKQRAEDLTNPLFRTNEFITFSKIRKNINICTISNRQILGLNEFFHSETGITFFTAECISDQAELYFLPKTSFFSMMNSDPDMIHKCAQFVEEKVKSFVFILNRYKNNFVKDIQHQLEENKRRNVFNNRRNVLFINAQQKLKYSNLVNNKESIDTIKGNHSYSPNKLLPMMNTKSSYTLRNTNKYYETEKEFYQTFTNGRKFGTFNNKQFYKQMMTMSLTQQGSSKWITKKQVPIISKSLNRKEKHIRMMKSNLFIDCHGNNSHNNPFAKTSRNKFAITCNTANNLKQNKKYRIRQNVSAGGNRAIKNRLTIDIK